MRRYQKVIFLFGAFTFFLTASYFIYTVSPREFFNEGITFAYANENLKNKNLDQFVDFLLEQGVEVNGVAVKKIQKNIDGFYILEDESLLASKRDPLLILDTGWRYYVYLMQIEKYFETAGDAYRLRDEFVQELGLDKIGLKNLYMYPYRGNFLFSTNSKKIHRAIDFRTSVSNNVAEFFDSKIRGNLGIASFNLKKDKVFGINTLTSVFDYENGKLDIDLILYLRETEMKENQKRGKDTLERYIKENRLYLNIPEYIKVFEIGKRFLMKDKKMEFLIGFWQTILGIDIPAILGDIDSEIIYDLETAEGIIKFGEIDRVERVVKSLENRKIPGLDHKLKLSGKNLLIGENELEAGYEKSVELKDNQIIYFENKIDGSEIKIEGYNYRKIIKIFIGLNNNALKNLIEKNLRKEGNEDDKDI